MFEQVVALPGGSGSPKAAPLSAQELRAMLAGLGRVDRDAHDAERIDRLSALEVVKSAAAAAQAVLTADFVASQRAAQRAAGCCPRPGSQGIGAQVALARRESPTAAPSMWVWPRPCSASCR